MKKILCLTLVASLLCAAVFADGFTVKKTVGKTNYETSSGAWKKINVGDKITGNTVIDIGLHSSIELVGEDGVTYSIKAMKKGSVSSIVGKANGIKKSSQSTARSVKEDKGTSTSVSTASTRADDAQSTVDWEEN